MVALMRYPTGPMIDRIRSVAEDEEVCYLTPPSVRAFLQPEPTVESTQRRRGPKESVTPRIVARMRGMDRHKFAAMKHEEMRAEFGAAPSTCAKARDIVLIGNSPD